MALDKAQIVSGNTVLEGNALAEIAKQYLLARSVIERESRLIDPVVLSALLDADTDLDLGSDSSVDTAIAAISAHIHHPDIALERVITEQGQLLIKITRKLHGNVMVSYIEQKFLAGKAYQTLLQTALMLNGLIGDDAVLFKGDTEQPVASFAEALAILMSGAQKGMSIQRYKGLGEMNPEQLWETTMDPAVRRLLKVRSEDAIAADEVFVTLMGDEVEPRRAFIENNALVAQNIDV